MRMPDHLNEETSIRCLRSVVISAETYQYLESDPMTQQKTLNSARKHFAEDLVFLTTIRHMMTAEVQTLVDLLQPSMASALSRDSITTWKHYPYPSFKLN